MVKRLPIRDRVKRRIDLFSRNECYHPNCLKKMVGEDGKTITGEIAHIESANEGGARFNSNMSNEDRRAFDNLILLCPEHHKIIDNKENEKQYPTKLLKNWKKRHEEISLKAFIKSKVPLTVLPFNTLCIGREDELDGIEKIFQLDDSLLLLNGLGGIGKTTLAKEYIKQYINSYDHIAYVEFKNNIKESFVSAFSYYFKFESQTIEEQFNELIYKLETIEGNNLLVVDNLENQKDLNIIKDIATNFKLLITSRVKFNGIENYHIDTLSKEKAKELFLQSHNTDKNIDNILKYIGYHTLFITLTAQVLENSDVLTIEKLEEKFKNKEFGDISNLDDNFDTKKFDKYLSELFKVNELKDEELDILKKLSLFPSYDIEFDDLKEFLVIENEVEFSNILNKLSKTGWLIKDKTTYKLHQIIKEFFLSNHKPIFDEVEEIIISLGNIIADLYEKNPVDTFPLIPYVTSVLDNIEDENEIVAISYNNISQIYQAMGELEKALEYQKKDLKIIKEILGKKHPDLATSYNNISMIYQVMGELEKALEYQKKTIEIREEILDEKHPDLAASYNNISMIYKAMGELEKALEYQKKALELREEILGEKHPDLAQSYNNISLIFIVKKDFKSAKIYIDKAVNILKYNFPNGHRSLETAVEIKEFIDSKLRD
jgi:tetratricopeptide (TPR) repeat protein